LAFARELGFGEPNARDFGIVLSECPSFVGRGIHGSGRIGASDRPAIRMALVANLCDNAEWSKRKERSEAALDRWDEEGRAQDVAWPLPYEASDLRDVERRVLECLGAALVSEWNDLPTDVQRRLFEHAVSGNRTPPPC